MGDELDRRRKSPWSGNSTQRAELRMRVWDLRKNGYSIREVAEACHISRGFAAALEEEEMADVPAAARDTYRVYMVERVGQMQRVALENFSRTGDWNAIRLYQWSEERLARLLGLDVPVVAKSEVTLRDGVTVDLETMMAEAETAEEAARATRDT